jgi:spermidine synthase
MAANLFTEHRPTGLAFYINGDLQFDTADEAIYHEYLVVPAVALAVQRFRDTPLRVLICGGGDGLAARDVLRFPQVRDVTLVDYDPAVLALGRTEFAPYNQGSLQGDSTQPLGADRVTVYTREAFAFVQQLPDACYHVVIADFTCPTRPEETAILSQEWFAQVHRILVPGGLFALNGVSPENTPTAFWCIYQTLLAAGFMAKPMGLSIPSFARLGYGLWGFFLAATEPITRTHLTEITFPEGLTTLTPEGLLQTFQFRAAIAAHRHHLYLNTLETPYLFYYLLNPPDVTAISETELVDFLDLQEASSGQIAPLNALQLEGMAQQWIECSRQADFEGVDFDGPDFAQLPALLPVQHYHHTPAMTEEWLGYLKALLAEIDPKILTEQLLERSKSLPPKLAQDLKQWATTLKTGAPLTNLSIHSSELMTVLMVTLLMANLATPEAVYAKGFGGSSSSFHGGGGSSGYYGGGYSDGSYYGGSGSVGHGGGLGCLGFWMMVVGGGWLFYLRQTKDRS